MQSVNLKNEAPMAKIEYKQGYEPLSGVYCGVQYKTNSNGSCSAFMLPMPTKRDAKKNPAARAERITKLCVIEIQRQMHNQPEAMRQYTNITHRVRRLYGQVFELESNEDKLVKMILDGYYQNRRVLPSRKVEGQRLVFDETDEVPT